MTGYKGWIAIGLVALASGWAGYRFSQSTSDRSDVLHAANLDALLTAPLSDLEGRPQSLTRWHGKALVINFWAAWCPPCREEMPTFSKYQQELGNAEIQFIGIAIDDPGQVREFLRTTPVTYPVLTAAASTLSLTSSLGNETQGLPFTILIDQHGQLVSAKLGLMTARDLRDRISALKPSKH